MGRAVGSVVVVLVLVALALVFWPTADPLAGVSTISLKGIRDNGSPAMQQARGPVEEGLQVTLGKRNIKIVATAEDADAEIEILLSESSLQLDSQGLKIRARCILTKKNGRSEVLDFYLTFTFSGGVLEAKLESRKVWEFWK